MCLTGDRQSLINGIQDRKLEAGTEAESVEERCKEVSDFLNLESQTVVSFYMSTHTEVSHREVAMENTELNRSHIT